MVEDGAGRRVPRATLALLLYAVLVLIGGSIALWDITASRLSTGREAALLGLFAIAGALGGVLRSLGYLLAFGSFSARERRQWNTEALVGPILGALAGLAIFLLVQASLVVGQVNRSGQYLLSVLAGASALALFGRIVERGLLRGSMSRSGILGAEVSPSIPLLSRIEQMLEQRIADLTIVNYEGYVVVTMNQVSGGGWRLNIVFDPHRDDASAKTQESVAMLKLGGGVEQKFVTFTLSVLSERYNAAPLLLTMTVPRDKRSEPGTILLREPEREADGENSGESIVARRRSVAVILEIGQGTQTVQVVPIDLVESTQ
jgi:hypothetical protein